MLKTLSEKFLTNASRLEFIICMLSIKTKVLLIAKAVCFSKPFGITLIYVSKLFIYQMTVIAFQIMKYYRSLFSQLKINIAVPMSRTSMFSCCIIMISYFDICYSNQFITYLVFITWFKTYFIFYLRNEIFIKTRFYNFFFNNHFL